MTLPLSDHAHAPMPPGRAGVAVALAGEPVVLLPAGVAWLPHSEALVVADLHLEKASSFARRGSFLPPYDTGATLTRLEQVVAAVAPRMVVALGDSFHDVGGPGRLASDDRVRLDRLTAATEWVWVTGNHDPEIPADLGGVVAAELRLGGLTLRHIPSEREGAGEIGGHLHPMIVVDGAGRRVRRRCFAWDGGRLLLPAFGTLTGGLSLAAAEFARLLDRRRTIAYALGRERLHAIPLMPHERRGVLAALS